MSVLIKSKELRNVIRTWAKYNEIQNDYNIQVNRGDWDHGGVCFYDSVVEFHEFYSRMRITVFLQEDEKQLIDGNTYTLKELIGIDEIDGTN